jgi:hypothetical protein
MRHPAIARHHQACSHPGDAALNTELSEIPDDEPMPLLAAPASLPIGCIAT